ncbi:MAG: hypothetical protein PQJ61_17325 [Spirochaetales bacterium]|uniref:Uncharacterized protein n=1 Tax=Candidatus Thalassospirochaeta sargassi TaxID=3119039 RepID=A0AAJ1MM20_9SPIO|nr:hypothetical protein [Spirochaetales bacterium]
MKQKYLTVQNVKDALKFLKSRRDHAKATNNKEWTKEYDNSIRVIAELSTIDV